jgi:hypothetical protein
LIRQGQGIFPEILSYATQRQQMAHKAQIFSGNAKVCVLKQKHRKTRSGRRTGREAGYSKTTISLNPLQQMLVLKHAA